MSLINKILLESKEDENLFKPRRLKPRKDQIKIKINTLLNDLNLNVNDIYCLKTFNDHTGTGSLYYVHAKSYYETQVVIILDKELGKSFVEQEKPTYISKLSEDIGEMTKLIKELNEIKEKDINQYKKYMDFFNNKVKVIKIITFQV